MTTFPAITPDTCRTWLWPILRHAKSAIQQIIIISLYRAGYISDADLQMLKLLADATITVIVVEHRDRLARFGVELVTAALEAGGRRLVVMNETESKDDLVQDMTDVLTSLCARLYGQRGAANRARRALAAAENAERANKP